MKQTAAAKERQAAEDAIRRERRARSAARTVAASMWNKETGERVDLEREAVTTPAETDARAAIATGAGSRAELVRFNRECNRMDEAAAGEAADKMIAWRAERAPERRPEELSWGEIHALADVSLADACAAWLRVQEFALDELESGRRAADVTGHASPLERARYLAVRDKVVDDWQPSGGVEWMMVEMLAQSFSLYLYWTEISVRRAISDADSMKQELRRFESSGWKSPYQSAADAVEQAHAMADRYNRMFLRVLRQMRDLRRYMKPQAPPVILNNGGQVNLASQQVNVNGAKG
jgi:hypothetical protein